MMIVKCKANHEVNENDVFCSECGNQIEKMEKVEFKPKKIHPNLRKKGSSIANVFSNEQSEIENQWVQDQLDNAKEVVKNATEIDIIESYVKDVLRDPSQNNETLWLMLATAIVMFAIITFYMLG